MAGKKKKHLNQVDQVETKKQPKGQIGVSALQLIPLIAILLVVSGIVIGVGALILANFAANPQVLASNSATQAVANASNGVGTFSGFQSLIALVSAAVVVLALVFGILGFVVGMTGEKKGLTSF